MKLSRLLPGILGLLLLVASCSSAEEDDRRLQGFFKEMGTTESSLHTDFDQDSEEGSAQATEPVKPKTKALYRIYSSEHERNIKKFVKQILKLFPEIIPEVQSDGGWIIRDYATFSQASKDSYATTFSSCLTELNYQDIIRDQAKFELGGNFLGLVLAHELAHCKSDNEKMSIEFTQQYVDAIGDDRLQKFVDAEWKCVDKLTWQWKSRSCKQ